jgi:hypothetical protein
MATSERQIPDADDSRRKIIIIVAVIAAIAIAGLFYLLMRTIGTTTQEPTLQGAIRAGSPEFAQYQSRIVLDPPEAEQSQQALGGLIMTLQTVAHNFTGRTLTGLEVKATVVDHQDKPVKERTLVVLPNGQQSDLEQNRAMLARVRIEGFTDKDDRANIKMEVTGFRFK